jgi:hypothetical protein
MFRLTRRRSKYGVLLDKQGKQARTLDGIVFHSKKECDRYAELKLLQAARIIRGLELQKEYPLIVNDMTIGTYVADFVYWHNEEQQVIVEDVKSPGTQTPVYRLKAKLVSALYGIRILET